MPYGAVTTKPAHVRRCPNHSKFRAGCRPCQQHSKFRLRNRRWEIDHGILGYVDPKDAVEHIGLLISEGNRTVVDVAAESGVSCKTIRDLIAGKRSHLLQVTAQSLLAIKPVPGRPRPRKGTMVSAIEGTRLVRGLTAQGWSLTHIGDLLGGISRASPSRIAAGRAKWMNPATRDRIRVVARELGPHDIDKTTQPLPGMSRHAATSAVRRGWHKLPAWKGIDITDPDAAPPTTAPHIPAHPEPADSTTQPMPYVDEMLAPLIRLTTEKIATTTPKAARRTEAYIEPLRNLTRLELHTVVVFASKCGISLVDQAALLGYPVHTDDERRNSQRAVSRIKAVADAAYHWLGNHPAGDIPRWFTDRPSGKLDFATQLPGLIALLPAPFGPGWDVTELAARCGLTEQQIRRFLTRAVPAGDAPQENHKIVNNRTAHTLVA